MVLSVQLPICCSNHHFLRSWPGIHIGSRRIWCTCRGTPSPISVALPKQQLDSGRMSEWNLFHPDSSPALNWAQVSDILFVLSDGVSLPASPTICRGQTSRRIELKADGSSFGWKQGDDGVVVTRSCCEGCGGARALHMSSVDQLRDR